MSAAFPSSFASLFALSLEEQKSRLARILVEKSYLEGDFTLTSGRKSDYYFDCRQSSLHPEGACLIGSLFLSMLEPDILAVAGMTMGADPLVTATSVLAFGRGRHLPALIVRKEAKDHGTARAVEGLANVAPGARVAVLEDVVSTGGSVLKACTKIEEAGLIVGGVYCILNRQEPGAEEAFAGRALHAVFTRASLLEYAHR